MAPAAKSPTSAHSILAGSSIVDVNGKLLHTIMRNIGRNLKLFALIVRRRHLKYGA